MMGFSKSASLIPLARQRHAAPAMVTSVGGVRCDIRSCPSYRIFGPDVHSRWQHPVSSTAREAAMFLLVFPCGDVADQNLMPPRLYAVLSQLPAGRCQAAKQREGQVVWG